MEETPREKANKNLVPFRGGPDARRGKGRGSPPTFATEEELDNFAKAIANGLNNKELAELFNCGLTTVKRYKKDPRVRALAAKATEARVVLITRITDRLILERLADASEMDTETLLRVRKEFLGGALRIQAQGGDAKDDKTITEAMERLEESPELAAELAEFLDSPSK